MPETTSSRVLNRVVSTRALNCEEANTMTVSGRNARPAFSGE